MPSFELNTQFMMLNATMLLMLLIWGVLSRKFAPAVHRQEFSLSINEMRAQIIANTNIIYPKYKDLEIILFDHNGMTTTRLVSPSANTVLLAGPAITHTGSVEAYNSGMGISKAFQGLLAMTGVMVEGALGDYIYNFEAGDI